MFKPWNEYSEDSKKYSKTSAPTEVLEAMCPKLENSKNHKFLLTALSECSVNKYLLNQWINEWIN